jgi:photosystem II stability/assembly factor-like uncharacterized protein
LSVSLATWTRLPSDGALDSRRNAQRACSCSAETTTATWTVEEPSLPGWEVFHAIEHDGTLYAAANNFVYGATVQRSKDGGKTWERSEGLGLPEETGLTLEKTWHVEPGHGDTLWLGAAPGALFRSDDRGENWSRS